MKKNSIYLCTFIIITIIAIGTIFYYIHNQDSVQYVMVDPVYYDNADKLINEADYIVKGNVVLQEKKLIDGLPYGVYSVYVNETYKGDKQATITFQKLIEEYYGIHASGGEPALQEHVEYLLLLKIYGGQMMPMGNQGCYEIGKQTEGEIQAEDIIKKLYSDEDQWIALDYANYFSNEELIEQADVIVEGTVTYVERNLQNGMPYSTYLLSITSIKKGSIEEEVKLNVLTKEFEHVHLSGDYPDLIEHQPYLFLLKKQDGYVTVVNGTQGYYKLEEANELLTILNNS